MSPEAPNNLGKRKQNRLSLKTAVAAAALAFTSPVAAQENGPQQTIEQAEQQEAELLSEAREALNEKRAYVESFRRLLGRDDTAALRETSDLLNRTEAALKNPAFIEGLKKIRRFGGKMGPFVGNVEPGLITDRHELDRRLNRTPAPLRGNFALTSEDLKENLPYSYDRPGFIEQAQRFSTAGAKLTGHRINALLNAMQDVPDAPDLILNAVSKSAGKISSEHLIFEATNRNISWQALRNPAFVGGIAHLSASGVDVLQLIPGHEVTDESRQQVEERIADPRFAEVAVELKRAGYKLNSSIMKFHADLYRDPVFLRNATNLQPQIGDFYYLIRYQDALRYPDMEALAGLLPADQIRNMLHYFVEKLPDDNARARAHDFVSQYGKNERMLDVLYRLDGARLNDGSYMSFLSQKIGERLAQEQYTFSALERIDEDYIGAQTGRGWVDLIRSGAFLQVVEQTPENSALATILKRYERIAYVAPVLRMNELHDDEQPLRRLEVIKNLSAQNLFQLMTVGGADAWLSTFRLIYNGNGFPGDAARNSFMPKAIQEYGSLHAFLLRANPDQKKFGTFLELLSQNNLMDTFLTDIGTPEQQQDIMVRFLLDASKGLAETQGITLSDLLQTTKNEKIREFVFSGLQTLSASEQQRDPKDRTAVIAGLVVAEYFRDTASAPQWAQPMLERYGRYFPQITNFNGKDAFRTEGNIEYNVQLHFFYDDRGDGKPQHTWDGHLSFRNFISSFGGTVTWDSKGVIQSVKSGRGASITDEGDYIKIVELSGKRVVTTYANKPDQSYEMVAKINGKLATDLQPQVYTHRGHSYHVRETIKQLRPDAKLVNLGSCGGAKNISDVLAKSPSAQVMATRAVGTMLVNDTLIRAVDKELIDKGGINWPQLRARLNTEFEGRSADARDRWQHYQLPHQNRTAHLISALNAVARSQP